ncbi:sugar ABC transporter ATP-binding protein [uncultured Sphaerochaeta sp.]|uniref:sugar ABC transporter ATP-binding protein n=1 Tax=uncultured Sphaerochaeta sp. TaxID=886478 RepID=UPI002A0A312D|nr:sugar ABC transporter ATP-binding protein [uncultured Sphaerochaeta sp.]
MDNTFALEMIEITKVFPGVRALDEVTFRVRPGTVHALMGENGAGKSTLMKCLFGIYREDHGTIILNGKECHFQDSHDALQNGVSMIHQELSNVPERSVAENIWLGREPLKKSHLIDHKKMNNDTEALLKRLEIQIDPTQRIGSLSISTQQTCEIAKAVSYNSSVVVMDEPTSSLTDNEVDRLFKIIRQLREQGVSIIYISHKMDEIFTIADEVSVMRDGKMIGTYDVKDINEGKLISLMVGRDAKLRFPERKNSIGNVCLKVENLTAHNPRSFKNISFELHKGEILGIGGLVGAQRTELMEALFGVRGIAEGKITVHGNELLHITPKLAIENGLGMITEDRRGSGIFPLMDISTNTSIASLGSFLTKLHLLDHREMNKAAVQYNEALRTKTPTMETLIQNLSGGNQQKVIISRWLMTLPDILIMDEPTRGIDVGAKYEIYTIMSQLVEEGKAIIMVSSEMPELIGMSDRIMVLCAGRHTGTLNKCDSTQESIMRLATQFM